MTITMGIVHKHTYGYCIVCVQLLAIVHWIDFNAICNEATDESMQKFSVPKQIPHLYKIIFLSAACDSILWFSYTTHNNTCLPNQKLFLSLSRTMKTNELKVF